MAKPVSAPPEVTRDTPPCRVEGCNLRGPVKVQHGGAVFHVCKRHQGLWPDVKLKPQAQWEKEWTRLRELAARADRISVEKGLVKAAGNVVPRAKTSMRARRRRPTEAASSSRRPRSTTSGSSAPRRDIPSIPQLRTDSTGELLDDGICLVLECGKPSYSRGACASHYRQARHHGWAHKLLPSKTIKGGRPKPMPSLRSSDAGELVDDDMCVVVGCTAEATRRGVCSTHYRQAGRGGWRDHLLPSRPGRRRLELKRDEDGRLARGEQCLVEGCDERGDVFGVCIQHWRMTPAPQRRELRQLDTTAAPVAVSRAVAEHERCYVALGEGGDTAGVRAPLDVMVSDLVCERDTLAAELEAERARNRSLLNVTASRGAVSLLLRAAPPELAGVVHAVLTERMANLERWGVQDYPNGTGTDPQGDREMADIGREACKRAAVEGRVTWRHVLDEEMLEAFAESDPAALRAELVQVGAVALAWLESLDRDLG